MANSRGQQMTILQDTPNKQVAPGFVHGQVRCFVEEITLASQAIGDTIEVAKLPKCSVVLYGLLNSSVTLGISTIEIGVTGSAGKYKAAGTFTTPNAPTLFGANAAVGEALATAETVIVTIGAANLPASGTLRVTVFYAVD